MAKARYLKEPAPLAVLPPEAKEGDWLVLEFAEGEDVEITRASLGPETTEQKKASIAKKWRVFAAATI